MSGAGQVVRATGPVVVATGLSGASLYDIVRVGPLGLIGEVVRLEDERVVVQVHEETHGLRVGDPVEATGAPLSVELGPGLLGGVFDGIQRSLTRWPVREADGSAAVSLGRGVESPGLDRARAWPFVPSVRVGDVVASGDVLGVVAETPAIAHTLRVPADGGGAVTAVADGPVRVDEAAVEVDGRPLAFLQQWPVRVPRPVIRRLDPNAPLVTGQRAIDFLFPIALGGTAVIPGGFGTGKTVQEHSLAKSCQADVIVYVACGERGNELAEVFDTFADQVDPRTGAPLAERTVFIANTSNMPIAAREASVYTGITIAEYFRDQGLHVALLADSTSRWAEALREISGRLGEMPGEEGYPAYLAARLAEFYERAGAAECLGADRPCGSVSIVGAVSPPGGDLSDPVTQQTLRLAGTYWSLDTDLARRRHFPAIHWSRSYSLYRLAPWFAVEVDPDWEPLRRWALGLLQREDELRAIVQLLGADALDPSQHAVLMTGRSLREDFLQQSAFDAVDACCGLAKQLAMVRVIRRGHEAIEAALARGVAPEAVLELEVVSEAARMREWTDEAAPERGADLAARLGDAIDRLGEEAA